MLNDSKIIVDVSTPSLHDHLTHLRFLIRRLYKNMLMHFSAMLFISHLYMLDLNQRNL